MSRPLRAGPLESWSETPPQLAEKLSYELRDASLTRYEQSTSTRHFGCGCRPALGFTFLELVVVLTVIGALASMAIPQYASYGKKAEAKSCLSNRRNIEMEERSHYIEKGTSNLVISQTYDCPSGGVYVWLVSDPQDDRYPQVGCSIHHAGEVSPSAPTTVTQTSSTTTTPPSTIDTTPGKGLAKGHDK